MCLGCEMIFKDVVWNKEETEDVRRICRLCRPKETDEEKEVRRWFAAARAARWENIIRRPICSQFGRRWRWDEDEDMWKEWKEISHEAWRRRGKRWSRKIAARLRLDGVGGWITAVLLGEL